MLKLKKNKVFYSKELTRFDKFYRINLIKQ